MDVVSYSPLRVGSLVWQHRPGGFALTVVVKATFLLQPDSLRFAEQQEPLRTVDCYWNDDPGRSLFCPTDLVPVKARADVTLVGSAFAPKGQPVNSLFVRLIVGELDKSIEVLKDRTIGLDGALVEEGRFASMPLVYERTSGGPETTNPVGVRMDARDGFGRVKLPNLVPLGTAISAANIPIVPIGFGPISPRWPSRWTKLGRHAGHFSIEQLASAPLPADFDRTFFQDAPADQQLNELTEDTRIILENLHPQFPRLVTNLPGLRPRVFVEGRGGSALNLRCDSLWINTDQGICTLTWRGHLPLERADEPGRIVVALEESTTSNGVRADGLSRNKPEEAATTTRGKAALVKDQEETDIFMAPTIAALPFVHATNAVQTTLPDERVPPTGVAFGPPPSPAPPIAPAAAFPFRSSAAPTWPGTPVPPIPNAPPVPPVPAASAPGGWTTPPPLPQASPRATSTQWPASPPSSLPVMQPPPVPTKVAPAKPSDESVWASGTTRADVASGQSIGQLAAAAAATAAPSQTVDATAGVGAASTAAAATTITALPDPKRPVDRLSQASGTSNPGPVVRPSGKLDLHEHLHLIWYAPNAVRRICRVPVWRAILDEMEREREDEAHEAPSVTQDPDDPEDARDIFDILAQGATQDVDQLEAELTAAVRPGGKFVPSLLLLAGEISFPFDERQVLEAAITTVTPILSGDETIKSAVRDARDFLSSGSACPPAIVDGYTARIREALGRGRKALTLEAFDAHVERVVLEGRHYQKRQVLGMKAIRALLHTATATGAKPAPIYMPDEIVMQLPLFSRFRARAIVELYIQEDQSETHPAALKVRALGRVHSFPQKKQ